MTINVQFELNWSLSLSLTYPFILEFHHSEWPFPQSPGQVGNPYQQIQTKQNKSTDLAPEKRIKDFPKSFRTARHASPPQSSPISASATMSNVAATFPIRCSSYLSLYLNQTPPSTQKKWLSNTSNLNQTPSSPCNVNDPWVGVICNDGVSTGLHLTQMNLFGKIDVDILLEVSTI